MSTGADDGLGVAELPCKPVRLIKDGVDGGSVSLLTSSSLNCMETKNKLKKTCKKMVNFKGTKKQRNQLASLTITTKTASYWKFANW